MSQPPGDTSGGSHDLRALETRLQRTDVTRFEGHVVDPARLDRRFAVEILVDGLSYGLAVAERFSEALSDAQMGDGCYAFRFELSQDVVDAAHLVEVRLANLDLPVGDPVKVLDPFRRVQTGPQRGSAKWLGGLRLSGWIGPLDDAEPIVTCQIDGRTVATARADCWRNPPDGDGEPVRGFDLYLPRSFADGRVWQATVKLADGTELGPAVTFCAFDEGLEALLPADATPGERLQGRLFDTLFPQSVPFSAYGELPAGPATPETVSLDDPIAVVIFGDGDPEVTTGSLDAQGNVAWTAAALPPLDAPWSFDPNDLRDFVEDTANDSTCFVFIAAGIAFQPEALSHFGRCFAETPDARLVYADFDLTEEDGVSWPVRLPAFDYERLLEQGYYAATFAMSRAAVLEALKVSVDNVFRLANVLLDDDPTGARIRHLPRALTRQTRRAIAQVTDQLRRASGDHLDAIGLPATLHATSSTLGPAVRVRRTHDSRPSVSIIVPTRNRVDLLRPCLQSIFAGAARVRAQIIVVDNGSTEGETLAFLDELRRQNIRVLAMPGPFNYAAMNNAAAREAQGDFLCFLNNDIEARDNAWLEEMLSRHADPQVGAVGAKLVWPSGVVQHGGVTLGVNFAAAHAFTDRMSDDPGYTDLLRVAHCCSAVTAACMTTPKELFLGMGGFDALNFSVNFNDLDYCLRLGVEGLRVVFTPHATLVHRESASRGQDQRFDTTSRAARELRTLRAKWGAALVADPFYHPALALDPYPYSALALSQRSWASRSNDVIKPRSVPPGV